MKTEIDEARKLLGARRGEWQLVHKKAGVSYSWLSKFYNGKISNPGSAIVGRLLKYLRK